jgi:hypothetical protein
MLESGEPLLPLLSSRIAASHVPVAALHDSVKAQSKSSVHPDSASLEAQPACAQLKTSTRPRTIHQAFPLRIIGVLEIVINSNHPFWVHK